MSDEDGERRYRVQLENGVEYPPSATAPCLPRAVAGVVEMAFKEGVKLGRAQAQDEQFTPSIGPFFDADNVTVEIGIETEEIEDGWPIYDWTAVEDVMPFVEGDT